MSRRAFDALRRSALLPGPRAALHALRPPPITYVEYDDLETERTLVTAADLAGD